MESTRKSEPLFTDELTEALNREDAQNRALANNEFNKANDSNNSAEKFTHYEAAVKHLVKVKDVISHDNFNLSECAYLAGVACTKQKERIALFNMSGSSLSYVPLQLVVNEWRRHAIRASKDGAELKMSLSNKNQYKKNDIYYYALGCLYQIPKTMLTSEELVQIQQLQAYFPSQDMTAPKNIQWGREREGDDLQEAKPKKKNSSIASLVKFGGHLFQKKKKYDDRDMLILDNSSEKDNISQIKLTSNAKFR